MVARWHHNWVWAGEREPVNGQAVHACGVFLFNRKITAFQEALPMDFQTYVTWLSLESLRNQVIWGRGACHPEQKPGYVSKKEGEKDYLMVSTPRLESLPEALDHQSCPCLDPSIDVRVPSPAGVLVVLNNLLYLTLS